ncbi:hypothetical protein RHMOL_Rhmol03G0164300 [Rhododendron molle]|uniref:Uncharacterized protein n=1 Tax=Rhododendron molle TaxID=49168 RepID=A0ACC0PHD1_RHOML|nr:hypothetical protein RHMOL_Rhmol03G0164300 [Rhododendron molle]
MLFDEVNGYTPEYIYGNYFKRVPQGKIYVEKREENEESEKDDKSEKKMGNLGLSELSGLGDSGEQADTSSESQCWVSKGSIGMGKLIKAKVSLWKLLPKYSICSCWFLGAGFGSSIGATAVEVYGRCSASDT